MMVILTRTGWSGLSLMFISLLKIFCKSSTWKNQLHIYEKKLYIFVMAWIWPSLDDHSKTKAQSFCTYLTMYADPFWAYTLKLQFQNACFHSFQHSIQYLLSYCTWNNSLKQAYYITKNEMLKYWRELHHSLPLGHKYLQLGYGVLIPFATNLVWVFWNILKKEFQNRGKSWTTDFF
jgi:hypothetical protein